MSKNTILTFKMTIFVVSDPDNLDELIQNGALSPDELLVKISYHQIMALIKSGAYGGAAFFKVRLKTCTSHMISNHVARFIAYTPMPPAYARRPGWVCTCWEHLSALKVDHGDKSQDNSESQGGR
jgi:hypothetical protein